MQITRRALYGDVRRATLAVAAPSLMAMLCSGAGALCDALLLAGKGSEATAAVALCFPILTMIQAVGFTLGMGAGSAVSRMLGAGDEDSARDCASLGLATALALSVLLCGAAFFGAGPLLGLLAAGRDVPPGAPLYARCLLACGPLMCASLVYGSLLRAQGMTLPNLHAYALGTAAGLGVQAGLMFAADLGVAAAGVALLVREGVTLTALLWGMARGKPGVCASLRRVRVRAELYKEIMRSGLPTLIRQGLFAISGAMVTSCAAAFGRDALSGIGLAVRAGALLSSGIIGFGQGFAPVCGVCYGAGDMARVRTAFLFCLRAMSGVLIMLGIAAAVYARRILLFFGASEAVAATGAAALAASGFTLPLQGMVVLCGMLTQAMGMSVRATLSGASRQGYMLIGVLMVLPKWWGLNGLIIAQAVADALSLMICIVFMCGIWEKAGGASETARSDGTARI